MLYWENQEKRRRGGHYGEIDPWHDDKDTGRDGAAIFLGIDLLQFLDEKFRDYEGYKEKLDETLRSIGRQE